jgi:transposase
MLGARIARGWRKMRVFLMGKRGRLRGSKYTVGFKRQLVAESLCEGASVLNVSRRHGVSTSRIYSWRSDARFQPDGSEVSGFIPIEIADEVRHAASVQPDGKLAPAAQIEITLENGRKLSVSDDVDAGFVLELARGLAA